MSARDPAGAFSPIAVTLMLVVGVACFAGFIVVFAFARGPGEGDGGAHAASRSAVGYAALVQLLRDVGTPVVLSRGETRDAGRRDGLLVLTPPPSAVPRPQPAEPAARRVLLVLPKWRTRALDEHPGWVDTVGVLPAATALDLFRNRPPETVLVRRDGLTRGRLTAAGAFTDAAATGPIDRLQVLGRSGLQPLLSDQQGGVVLGTDGRGGYVLSDPDLLNDAGLVEPGAAASAVSMLRVLADGQPVTFDLSLDGFGRSRDPLRAMLEPPLLGAALCAAAACLLLGLVSAVRFGPAAAEGRRFELGKAALAANSAALIARAGREARMAVPYAELTRTLAARALGVLPRRGSEDTATMLDRLARQRSADVAPFGDVLAQAGSVRNRAGLLESARAAYAWRQEVVRGDR